jgi:hypothetical protein
MVSSDGIWKVEIQISKKPESKIPQERINIIIFLEILF